MKDVTANRENFKAMDALKEAPDDVLLFIFQVLKDFPEYRIGAPISEICEEWRESDQSVRRNVDLVKEHGLGYRSGSDWVVFNRGVPEALKQEGFPL